MTKRKKRLEKGIASLEEQRTLHKHKHAAAEEEGKNELARYYDKELRSIEERIRERKEKLAKQR